jgi:hypothetical protein
VVQPVEGVAVVVRDRQLGVSAAGHAEKLGERCRDEADDEGANAHRRQKLDQRHSRLAVFPLHRSTL